MAGKPRSKQRRIKWVTRRRAPLYAPPGTLSVDPAAPKPRIRVIAYGPDQFVDQPIDQPQQVTQFLHTHAVTWVNVDGLGDLDTIRSIGEIFKLHRLALEDVVHVRQRPKVDEYDEHLYIVARMYEQTNGRIGTEQLSMFLGRDFVLTFQERPGDCLDAIRARCREKRGRVRDAGPDYLAYAILDAVVDEYFPVLEATGDRLEELESQVLANPQTAVAADVHETKRRLLLFRRAIWPLREALGALHRTTSPIVAASTRVYLRDAYDHTVQLLDLIEVYRELCTGLTEMYMTAVSHRMNEVMKVLTMIATIFIPLTFIVGIYGMNFDPRSSPWSMPELRWRYGYPATLLVMALIGGGMLLYFRRKGWMRSDEPRNSPPLDDLEK